MTRSSGARFINNTCFPNAQNSTGDQRGALTNRRSSTSEQHGSPDPAKTGVTFLNNLR